MDWSGRPIPGSCGCANRKKLLAAGISEETARKFEDNPSVSLSLQTALIQSLDTLAGVRGRETLIARAIDAESRDEASTLVSSVALMVRFHRQQSPLLEILPGARLPVARAANGALVAVLLTDAVFWTAEVAEGAQSFADRYAGDPAKERQLWVAGEASLAFKSAARALGWETRDRWQLSSPEDAAAAAPASR